MTWSTVQPGATASTYVIQTADENHSLACEVSATNEFGKASATSNTLTVQPPPSATPLPTTTVVAPVITLSSAKLVVSGGAARVPIACKNGSCSGTIELTEQVAVKHHRGKKTTSKKETLIVAEGPYSLAAGHSATIAVHVTAKGESALAAAKHHKLSAQFSASLSDGKSVNESITLSEAPPAKRKAKHR